MNASNCHPERSSTYDTVSKTCLCWAGFYGPTCAEKHAWYAPVMITVHALQSVMLIASMIWAALRVYHLVQQNQKHSAKGSKGHLAMIISILVVIADVAMLVFLWTPSMSLFNTPQPPLLTTIKATILFFALVFWLIGSTLTAGFWHDAIALKSGKLTSMKRLIFALVMGQILFAIIGVVMGLTGFQAFSVIALLILMFFNMCLLAYISVRLHRTKLMNQNNADTKKRYVVKMLVSIDVLWLASLLAHLLSVGFALAKLDVYNIIWTSTERLCAGSIALLMMFLLDYKQRTLRHTLGIAQLPSGSRVSASTDMSRPSKSGMTGTSTEEAEAKTLETV